MSFTRRKLNMNGCQSKKFAVMLAASAFCYVASAVTYYNWNVRTGGNLDDPLNWNKGAVPTNDIDNVIDQLLYSQSAPMTLQRDMSTGAIYAFAFAGTDGTTLDFDLAPYTLTTKSVSGAYGFTFGSGDFKPSKIALVSGTVVSPVVGFAASNLADGGGHYFAIDGDYATITTKYFICTSNNNKLDIKNGAVYAAVFTSGSGKTNNVVSISGNGRLITLVEAKNNLMNKIGRGGSYDRMEIFDGGVYSNLQTTTAFSVDYNESGPGGGNNSVVVRNGTFSKPEGDVYVGYNGSSNLMSATGGAFVKVNALYLGYLSASRSTSSGDRTCRNSLQVSDPGTVFEASNVTVGRYFSDYNELVVTNAATFSLSGSLRVGLENTVGDRAYFGPGVALSVNGYFAVGWGTMCKGSSAVIDGAFFDKSGSYGVLVGRYGSGNSLILQNGATVVCTNIEVNVNSDMCPVFVGLYSGASNNTLRIASGSTLKCHVIEISCKAGSGRNVLELDNGSYLSLQKPGSTVTPRVRFDYGQQSAANSLLLFKGTNSYLRASRTDLSMVRYEIPADGLADAKMTEAVCEAGNLYRAPNSVEVDIDGACPKGKWLLMKWNADSTSGFKTADFISRSSITGAGANRASLVAGNCEVYLKVKGTDGMLLIYR